MNPRADQFRKTDAPAAPAAGARAGACTRGCAGGGRGFSLVEAMVSAGIVGVMLVASVNLLSSAARTRSADNNRRAALMLAQHLMSEVQQQPYKDASPLNILFGPEAMEVSRADYDDVDDYRNYTEKPPLYRTGLPIPDHGAWQRKVKVKWVNPGTLTDSLVDTGIVMIEVRVTDPRGIETAISALRAERAAPADPPLAGSTWVNWMEVELQVDGDPPRHVITGAQAVVRPPTTTN
jgi:type II secretory pathway pseudopilin PulG